MKSNMVNKNDTKKGILLIAGIIIYTIALVEYAKRNIVSTIIDRNWKYYILLMLIVIICFFAVKNKKIFTLYSILIFSFFAWYSFADLLYSPIDECMNFESINHIVSDGTLPTFEDDIDYEYLNSMNAGRQEIGKGVNYEAVQAPLYYLVLALVGMIIKQAYFRLVLFRLIGLFSVLIIYYFVIRSVKVLETYNLINSDDSVFRLGIMLTIFNPAYLYRASRLNNEIFVCILMSVLIYLAVKCICEGYRAQYYWEISVLCIALFMTKTTAIYAYIVIGIIAVVQKHIRQAIFPVLSSALFSVPWFVFNYGTYHSLTAMKNHLDYVIPIVNPQKVEQDWIAACLSFFPTTFFSGEEVAFSSSEVFFISTAFFLFLVLIIGVIIWTLRQCKEKKWDKKVYLNIVFVSLIMACLACLIAGTISTKVNSVRGRYFYGPSVVIILLLIINADSIIQNQKKCGKLVLIITCAVVLNRNFITYVDKYLSQENLFAENVVGVQISEFSDGEKIYIEERDSGKYRSYQELNNHKIICGNETAIITKVSEVIKEDGGSYVELTLNRPFEIFENTASIGHYCESDTYYIPDELVDNIEGEEIQQSIQIHKNGELWGYEIFLATYSIPNYSANIEYSIYDSNHNILEQGTRRLESIEDNSYSRLYFDDAIQVEKGENIYITLKYDNEDDMPLATKTVEYGGNDKLIIDGIVQEGRELGIKLLTIY